MKTTPTTYGYVVAPHGDKAARADQMQALEEYTPDYLLIDREYKTRTNRTSLEQILSLLQPKDVLVTTKIAPSDPWWSRHLYPIPRGRATHVADVACKGA